MNEVKLAVLQVDQPIGTFYIASISSRDLVAISYSDVRRLVQDERDLERYLGIQRPVSPSRIKRIKEYIQSSDATFPTSVILAVDEKCAEFKEVTKQLGRLTLRAYNDPQDDENSIPFERIAKVIDGQHRIAAFMDESHNFSFDLDNRPFDINVAIFIGADVSEQANIFATVNLAQTKVNRSLVYDLTELAQAPSPHKTCHNVAVALDAEPSSPLYKRIKRLGTATPGRKKEPLTQASFVESLVKFISLNPAKDRDIYLDGGKIKRISPEEHQKCPFRGLFVKGREVDISEILYNYFTAVRNKWPKSWDNIETVGNILPRSNAFKALMVYLREDVYPRLTEEQGVEIPTVDDFSTAFAHIKLKDKDFTTVNFKPGSGGQSTFLKMLRGQVSLSDMIES